jgi:hypothetical protein
VIIFLLLAVGAIFFAVRRARRPRGFRPELGAVGWSEGTRWAVVGPLARVETRRLLTHPAFIAGAVLSPLLLFAATNRDAGNDWVQLSTGVALGLAPLGWFTIAAAQLLTTRPERTGADGLFASLPAPQPTRTAALLGTMTGAVGVAVGFAAVTVALLSTQDRVFPGVPDLAEITAGVLLGAGAVTVGVAIGRFLPHPLFSVGGVIAVIVIQARFFDPTTWPWNRGEASPVRFFGFLGTDTSAPPALEYRPAEWHLVYLVGFIGVMAVVALARNGVPRQLGVALAIAVAVVLAGGWAQTRPAPAGRVAQMVSYLEDPLAHQRCTDRVAARYCTYGNGEQTIPLWDARARDVLALLPAPPPRLVVVERVPTVIGNSNCSAIPFTDSLPAAVRRSLDVRRVWAADGAVHPGTDALPCSSTSVSGLFFAVQVGSWAVGLPSSPQAGDERCYADGQSRSALALWLGAAVTPGGKQRLAKLLDEEFTDHLRFRDWNEPPMWGVHFANGDTRVALAMLDRPPNSIASTLAPQWKRLTTPGTPTAELVRALGLATNATTMSPTAPACA